jgi:hypothetical protein
MNDAILSLIIASASGLLAMVVRYSYYSKCDTIECCCCKLHRMVGNETTNNPTDENNETAVSVQPITPQNQTLAKKQPFKT